MLKIGLFGGSGQLGRALQRDLACLGQVLAPTRQQLDLADVTAVQKWLQHQQCDVLVNAAAMTQVDMAEQFHEIAFQLNQQLVQVLAEYVAAQQIWLVHFSTDYVFDGSGERPWNETDKCDPLQYYGRSKRAGELAIQQSGCKHLVFRTSWLYDSQGQNFVLTMLRLASEFLAGQPVIKSVGQSIEKSDGQAPNNPQQALKVVADQIGAPTYAPALSVWVTQILIQLFAKPTHQARAVSGIYHLCAAGNCSWFEFASAILAGAVKKGLLEQQRGLQAVSSSEFVRPAMRPLNSRLDTRKVQTTFALELTDWQQQLEQCLERLKLSAKTGK